jgi:hypothetical protein
VNYLPENDLESWAPVIRKALGLLVTVLGAYAAGSAEVAARGELQATETAAGEGVRVEAIVDTQYDVLQSYVAREAACDSALESFSRHRDDERDWAHVVENCHSDGELP